MNSTKLIDTKIPLAICLFGFFVWEGLLTFKYYHFGFYDWDFAIYDQIVWNLCHGSLWSSLIGWNFLADHAHYIAFLVAPIYYLFPHPLTLIYLELFSFFGGAFILYKIVKMFLPEWAALIVMVLYIIHPANIFMLFYEFHFESLAIGLIFLLFYFFQKQRLGAFLMTAVVLMLVKENMSLIVVMFGIYRFFAKREQKIRWGVLPFILGTVYFLTIMFVVTPCIRKGFPYTNNIYWSLYNNLGNSPQSILQTFLFHPSKVIHVIWTKQNLKYICDLLVPFSFLPLLSPHILIVSLPILLQNCLSNTWQLHTIYFHYAATIVPFVALACAYSMAFIKRKIGNWIYKAALVVIIIFSLCRFSYYWPTWQAKVQSWADPSDTAREILIEKIPADAGVIASFDFLSHLTHHKYLYAFYNVWRDVDYFTGQTPFILPKTVQYALIDFNDPWLKADLQNNFEFTNSRVRNFLSSGWVIQEHYDSMVLYKRKG